MRIRCVAVVFSLLAGLFAASSRALAYGRTVTFFDDNKTLPASYRLGLEYEKDNAAHVCLDGVERQLGLANLRAGLEWRPAKSVTARVGYKTDMPQGLSKEAGIGAVLQFPILDQHVSYAIFPIAQHGVSHYVSLTFRFGEH